MCPLYSSFIHSLSMLKLLLLYDTTKTRSNANNFNSFVCNTNIVLLLHNHSFFLMIETTKELRAAVNIIIDSSRLTSNSWWNTNNSLSFLNQSMAFRNLTQDIKCCITLSWLFFSSSETWTIISLVILIILLTKFFLFLSTTAQLYQKQYLRHQSKCKPSSLQ